MPLSFAENLSYLKKFLWEIKSHVKIFLLRWFTGEKERTASVFMLQPQGNNLKAFGLIKALGRFMGFVRDDTKLSYKIYFWLKKCKQNHSSGFSGDMPLYHWNLLLLNEGDLSTSQFFKKLKYLKLFIRT